MEIEKLIDKCLGELRVAQEEKYDTDKAEKTAALFLEVQARLALMSQDLEIKSRLLKNDIERIGGEKYFEYKTGEKKTENALEQLLAKDKDLLIAKEVAVKAEAEIKKYNYLMKVVDSGHVFFRGLAKNKNGSTWE